MLYNFKGGVSTSVITLYEVGRVIKITFLRYIIYGRPHVFPGIPLYHYSNMPTLILAIN